MGLPLGKNKAIYSVTEKLKFPFNRRKQSIPSKNFCGMAIARDTLNLEKKYFR